MNIDEMITDCENQLEIQLKTKNLAEINIHRLQGAIAVLKQLKTEEGGDADGGISNTN